jgi:hypothetical protein
MYFGSTSAAPSPCVLSLNLNPYGSKNPFAFLPNILGPLGGFGPLILQFFLGNDEECAWPFVITENPCLAYKKISHYATGRIDALKWSRNGIIGFALFFVAFSSIPFCSTKK